MRNSDEALELMRDNCTATRDLAIIDLLADIDFNVYYLMQELNGTLRVFGWISGDEQETLKQYGVI